MGDDKTLSQLVAYMSGALRRVGFSVNYGSVYGCKLQDSAFENVLSAGAVRVEGREQKKWKYGMENMKKW